MHAPLITVVIPTHNRLKFLKEAVKSVLGQPQALELIVVDDHSSDGSREWIASQSDPRLSYIFLSQHSERSAARNRALAGAKGDLILFLDDDDQLAPGSLAVLAEEIGSHPRAVASVGAAVYFDEAGQVRRQRHPRRRRLLDVRDEVMFGWPAHPGSTLWRTDRMRELGGWPEHLSQGEDQDLWLRFAERGPVAFRPEPVLFYRKHPAQFRPPDTYLIERQLRERFIEGLPAQRRTQALRVLKARELREEGVHAWRQNDLRLAASRFLATIWVAPQLLWSPLLGGRMRSLIIRSLVGCVVGPRVTAAAQRLLWSVRRRVGRAPGGPEPMLPTRSPKEIDP